MGDDVTFDLAAQRAGGDGQGDADGDVAALDGDGPDHAEVDDRVAQFGVDDGPQAVPDLLLAALPRGLRRGRCQWGGRCHRLELYLRGGEFRPWPAGVPGSARRR